MENHYLNVIGATRLADLSFLDELKIPVIACIRPNAKHLTISLGKGLDKQQAELSATMEAIELFSLENLEQGAINGSYKTLIKRYPVIDPQALNTSRFKKNVREVKFNWIKCELIKSSETAYIPFEAASLDSTCRKACFSYFQVSTNGMGAATDKLTALNHAIMELLERKRFHDWCLLNETERSKSVIDLSACSSVKLKKLIRQTQKAGFNLIVWNISGEGELPVVYCELRKQGAEGGRYSGSCAAPDIEQAVIGAILEGAQARVALISGSRDDIFESYYQKNTKLALSIPEPQVSLEQLKKPLRVDSQLALNQQLVDILNSEFEDVLLLDLTHKDLGVYVYKVIVPGSVFDESR
jgi:YcaO-like protein with predicted kinase domain